MMVLLSSGFSQVSPARQGVVVFAPQQSAAADCWHAMQHRHGTMHVLSGKARLRGRGAAFGAQRQAQQAQHVPHPHRCGCSSSSPKSPRQVGPADRQTAPTGWDVVNGAFRGGQREGRQAHPCLSQPRWTSQAPFTHRPAAGQRCPPPTLPPTHPPTHSNTGLQQGGGAVDQDGGGDALVPGQRGGG